MNARDWEARVTTVLGKRGYDPGSIADHCRALAEHGSLVERHSFLVPRLRSATPSSRRRASRQGYLHASTGSISLTL